VITKRSAAESSFHRMDPPKGSHPNRDQASWQLEHRGREAAASTAESAAAPSFTVSAPALTGANQSSSIQSREQQLQQPQWQGEAAHSDGQHRPRKRAAIGNEEQASVDEELQHATSENMAEPLRNRAAQERGRIENAELTAYSQRQAQNQLLGVVPAPDALLSSSVSSQRLPTLAALNRDVFQQAERCLDTQWAVLDCFLKWLCSSAPCSEQHWALLTGQDCVLWLPVGSVYNTAAALEAAQQCRTLVRFTGAAEIFSYGRQHFLQAAHRAYAATTAAAATADASAAGHMPDVQLQIVIERREMYTRCSDSMSSGNGSNTSYIGAPFMCRNAVTQGSGGVVGVAMCTFVTDAVSSLERLSSVQLVYDTYAMHTVLAAAAAVPLVSAAARETTPLLGERYKTVAVGKNSRIYLC
jgi:hypothetical protein